jgi:hypothetical protein
MINRRFMIVPPALPSGGHAEPLEQTSKDFLCLLLEMANMRVPLEQAGGLKAPLPAGKKVVAYIHLLGDGGGLP